MKGIMRLACCAALTLAAGCAPSKTSGASASGDAVASADVSQDVSTPSTTYHGEARAILEQRCVSCHFEGGGAPFTLDWRADEWSEGPAWWTGIIMNAIEEGRMPPWKPSADCIPIENQKMLLPEERATLAAWQAEGFPQGSEDAYEPPEVESAPALPEPTITMTPSGAYTPDPSHPDDYRCFVMDATFDTDRYATRTDVWPGSLDVVHHVILYRVSGDSMAEVEAMDAASDGLGYPCYGGPGVAGDFIGAWVPGSTAFEFPAGSAIELPAGSRIVMQMHYNTVYLEPDTPVPSDLTTMALWLLPEGEKPKELTYFQAMANTDIFIPANDPASAHVQSRYLGWNAEVVGVAPHMHQLGTEIRVSLVDEDGASSCLIDIPKWDFNWQQLYMFSEENSPFVHGLTSHRMTCVYDNTPSNQPVVNGEQSDPTNVTWGDGSFDEMCLNYVLMKFPFEATQHTCGNYRWCAARCSGDIACALGCAVGAGGACADCINEGYVACGQEHCETQTAAALACTGPCVDSGAEIQECIAGDCRGSWQEAHDCIAPLMEGPECAEHFASCDFGE